jgi:hypothetical protein
VKLRSVDDAKRIWKPRKLLQPSCLRASLALWFGQDVGGLRGRAAATSRLAPIQLYI